MSLTWALPAGGIALRWGCCLLWAPVAGWGDPRTGALTCDRVPGGGALKNHREPWTGGELAEQVGDPRTLEVEMDFKEALALLAGLKQQRTVLALRVAGLSYEEIAELTGRAYTWVTRHATEGRAKPRQQRLRYGVLVH
jgi:hypothetical protein